MLPKKTEAFVVLPRDVGSFSIYIYSNIVIAKDRTHTQ